MSHHHIKKFSVFGDGEVIECCRTPCHDALEELITQRENEILSQHPEIYTNALNEVAGNHALITELYRNIEERRRAKRKKGWRYK